MLTIAVVVTAAVFGMIDWRVLKKKRMRRERVVTLLFWLAGLGSALCSLYGMKMPSLLLVLKVVYEPVNKLFGLWFH
ncbi:hypothetical protein D3C81_1811520 [compost metagenome]